MQSIELLAPAGSLEAAKAAVNAGADAIYMGGPLFSARAYAESAGTDMLSEAIQYCHLRGVKVYMTLNTLMKDAEMNGLYEYLLPYYQEGIDAVIVQDLGVLRFVRAQFPDLPIHASTQMTVTGRYSAALLKRLGASRIVTARELSLQEIRTISEHVDIEIESFIHGALCYCYSGQCLMSSMLGGRSGNRGRCAGPCRLSYEVFDENGKRLLAKSGAGEERLGVRESKARMDAKAGTSGFRTSAVSAKTDAGGTYVLSMKDFNTLADLPKLLSAGVMSLKIEGRMKPPLYVASVVSVYRKYLDRCIEEMSRTRTERTADADRDRKTAAEAGCDKKLPSALCIDAEDERLLREAATRSASTDGYLHIHNGRDMLTLFEKTARIPKEDLLDKVRKKYLSEELRVPVRAEAVFEIGKPARFKLFCAYRDIEAEAEAVSVYPEREVLAERAQNQVLSEERLRSALEKFGGTPFQLEALRIHAEEGLFFPVRELNELRRKAVGLLSEKILEKSERKQGGAENAYTCFRGK